MTKSIRKNTIKKPSVKKLIKELDRVFSIYIRKRDHHICFTCGKKLTEKTSQCGHYVSRRYGNLRFCEKNCHAQCSGCNIFKHGNMDSYALRLINKYGKNILEELNREKLKTKKFTVTELENLIKHYKELI